MTRMTHGMELRSTAKQRTRWHTQDEAYASVIPHEGSIERTVYDAICAKPSTCDELEQLLGLTHQTCSARVNALMSRGLIETRSHRMTRSGRSARVWSRREATTLWEVQR
jgi:predicted ArsR family transcriptional regulator